MEPQVQMEPSSINPQLKVSNFEGASNQLKNPVEMEPSSINPLVETVRRRIERPFFRVA